MTEPSAREFRPVDDPDERTGEERSTIPEAIEAASGAEASISGTFSPRVRASSISCCARACSASAESKWSTSDRYRCSSRIDVALMVGESSMVCFCFLFFLCTKGDGWVGGGRLASGRACTGGAAGMRGCADAREESDV